MPQRIDTCEDLLLVRTATIESRGHSIFNSVTDRVEQVFTCVEMLWLECVICSQSIALFQASYKSFIYNCIFSLIPFAT